MSKRAYIVDIDGTLADISHRLRFIEAQPKQWDDFFEACSDDLPIEDVIDVVRAIACEQEGVRGPEIVYLTGRPERVRDKTNVWLACNGLPAGRLIMRKDGDHRPDTTAKRELMDAIIADGYRIAGVFEDRPSVVRVWREMGLTVFQMRHDDF